MDLQTWLTVNWQPLLIGAVIGLILGWLITLLVMRGNQRRLEAAYSDLDAKAKGSDSDLVVTRKQIQTIQAERDSLQAHLGEANSKFAALQLELDARDSELAKVKTELTSELAKVKTELTSEHREADLSLAMAAGESESLKATLEFLKSENETHKTEIETLKLNLEGLSLDLAEAHQEAETAAQVLANKDTALNEAYVRAVKLQRELTDQQNLVGSFQSELIVLRREAATLTSANKEMEAKLHQTRGDVANELAVLTSTMLRVKDDSLAHANATIAALTSQLNDVRTAKSASA